MTKNAHELEVQYFLCHASFQVMPCSVSEPPTCWKRIDAVTVLRAVMVSQVVVLIAPMLQPSPGLV